MTGGLGEAHGRRLGEALRDFRQRAGLTQRQAAELAGVSLGGLRDLEQGRVPTPRPATLRRLATALTLSSDEAAALIQLARRGPVTAHDLRVQVLGPVTVEIGGSPVNPGSPRQQLLLGRLALSPNVPVPRDDLVAVVWGTHPPENATDLLQAAVSRLRRRLVPHPGAPAVLIAAGGGYLLSMADEQLDLLAFRRLVTQARRANQDGDAARSCTRYAEAIALWRGEPVAGHPSLRAHPTVVALDRELRAAVVEYADVATGLGRHDEVLPALRRVTEADPLDEVAHARLMLALAGNGHQSEALSVYSGVRQRLAEEFGAAPGPDLREAHGRVFRQEVGDPAVVTADTVGVHRQLPPDTADFIGREAELRAAHDRIADLAENCRAIGLVAIEGMAGVGKTRFAIHLARRLLARGDYDDVQLYVDLRGRSDEPPADPSAVLAMFLHVLGVPGDRMPQSLDGRAAVYRDRLHDRKALVLLDNAASMDQVLPLLPSGPANLVLVTSRQSIALDGAYTLSLDVFTSSEAHTLLTEIVGQARVEAEPEAAREVVELCGRLPLAVALIARRLQARPTWRFSDLVARLGQHGARISELTAGTRRVRAAFDLSYRALGPAAQRVFRRLGLHPGHEYTADSVAALCGIDPAGAGRALDQLVDEHLAMIATGDRYRMHSLLRDYAREIVTEEDERTRRAAIERLLHWYLHAVDLTRQRLFPNRSSNLGGHGETPPHLPRFATAAAALDWLEAEHATLAAATELAVEWGFPRIAWQLGVALGDYFDRLAGRPDRAAMYWEQALTLLENLPHADAEELTGLRARLEADIAATRSAGSNLRSIGGRPGR